MNGWRGDLYKPPRKLQYGYIHVDSGTVFGFASSLI